MTLLGAGVIACLPESRADSQLGGPGALSLHDSSIMEAAELVFLQVPEGMSAASRSSFGNKTLWPERACLATPGLLGRFPSSGQGHVVPGVRNMYDDKGLRLCGAVWSGKGHFFRVEKWKSTP